MRFKKYINEATNGVFSKVKINKSLIKKKTKYTIIEVGKVPKNFDAWSMGKSVIFTKTLSNPKSKGKKSFWSKVSDIKGGIHYLVGGKQATAPGEFDMAWENAPTGRLKIETTTVLKSHKITQFKTPTLIFPAYVFDNINDIIRCVNIGFDKMKGIPQYIKDTIKLNMVSPFHQFDWHTIDEKVERNEIAVYFGEILVAMSLLNKEMGVFKGNLIPKGEIVKKVIFPTSPSFKAVDSIVETDKGTIIKISSKKGKGASASLYGNVILHILDLNIDVGNTVLNELVQSSQGYNLKRDVLSAMYEWAFKHTNIFKDINIGPSDFKTELVKYKKSGESGFQEQFDKVSNNIIKNNSSHFKGKKLDNLPFSISHYISGEMAERLNNDKQSMALILRILGEENYFQVSLNNNFIKTGNAQYTVKHSGSNNIRILSSRAVFGDPSLSQAKINYEIY